MAKTKADEQTDRLEQLLDVGLAALKGGDDESALLALQEALKTIEAIPAAAKEVVIGGSTLSPPRPKG